MMLVPYTRRNRDLNCYNPFRAFDDLERAFFSDRTPAEFRTASTRRTSMLIWTRAA